MNQLAPPRTWVRRLRRLAAWSATACLIVLAALLVVYSTRDRWLAPWIVRQAEQRLVTATGAQVLIGALGGDWVRTVELSDLAWRDSRPEAVLLEAEAERLLVRWNPWKALRGEDDWITAVEVDGLRVRARAGGGATPPAGAAPTARTPRQLPAHLPTLALRGADVELVLDAGTLALREGLLELGPLVDSRQAARLEASRLSWEALSGPSYSGRLESDLAWSRPRLAIDSVVLDGVERVSAAWIDVAELVRGSLSWDARLAVLGGALQARGSLREGALDVDLQLESVALRPALELVFPERAQLPEAILAGRGALHLEAGRPDALRASFAGRAGQVVLAGRAIEEIEAEVELANGVLAVQRLLARRGAGSLAASELSLPLGLDGLETLRAARGSIQLTAADLPAWLGTPPPPGSLVSRAPTHTLELAARLTGEGLELERGRLTTAGGIADVRPSSIRWGPPGRMLEQARVDVDLDLDFRDLSDLGPVLAIEGRWGGSLRGRLALDGTWGAVVGGLDVEGLDVVAADIELGELSVLAAVDTERIEVTRLRAAGPIGRLSLEGAWDLAERSFERVHVTAATQAPQVWLPGVLAAGEVELDAQASGPPLDPRGRFEVHASALELARLPGQVLDQVGLVARLDHDIVSVERLRLELAALEVTGHGEVTHSGWALPLELRLDGLTARLDELDLSLVEPARVLVAEGSLDTGPLRWAGSAGELDADLEGGPGHFSAHLAARRLDPMPLLAPLAPAGFDLEGLQGELSVDLGEGALTARGRLEVARLLPALGLPELRGALVGSLGSGRVALERLEIESRSGQRLELQGEAPLDPLGPTIFSAGPLDLSGRLEVDELASLPLALGASRLSLTGAAEIDFELQGDWRGLTGQAAVEGRQLALTSPSGTALLGPATFSGRMEVGEDRVGLDELFLSAPGQLELVGSGQMLSGLEPARWIEAGVDELLAAPLGLRLELAAADLAYVARLSPSLRRVAGRLAGELEVGGSLLRPTVQGGLDVEDGELRLVGDFPSIDLLRARLELDPSRLRLVRLSGEMGGGPIEGEGELDWSEGPFVARLELRGSEVLLVQQPTLRVRADAAVTVAGPLDGLEVRGRLGLREGRYTKRIDLFGRGPSTRAAPGPPIRLFSFEQGPLATMRLDVQVDSIEPFRIENNLVRGSVRADLRLTGTGADPSLVGALFVDPTRVNLPATVMQTTSGTLVFSAQDPLMPQLDVRLETRVRSFDVQARATGPLEDPQLELTSIPPLPSEDLLVLVLTGKPPELTWDARTGEQAAQTVAFYVGKDLLEEWFTDPGSESSDSWLDRIEYRTGVDVTTSGEETSELSIRIVGEPTGTGRTVWLRAENDAYDRINYGVRLLFRLK